MLEHAPYRRYAGKAEIEKAINSLKGLIEGIAIDRLINAHELQFLHMWLDEHRRYSSKHPFNELFPVVESAITDGVLTNEEQADILWLCDQLLSERYFDSVTTDMQRLHAMIAGIASDGQISVEELRGLSKWLQKHEHLRRCWPYDEIDTLITSVLADKLIDPEEHALLMQFFGEFIAILDNRTVTMPPVAEGSTLTGLCAVCPDISFQGSVFCLTGASHRYSRKQLYSLIQELGGKTANGVSKKVQYLIVGAEGNPCWAFACYGRKVEQAVKLRKEGHTILIVHENDLHDAIADL
ncbi:NAD-dependent DNA ligase (contains BRCT domain type II) [Isoalcanivorax pacificus W11-5]|uniref:NAD-dependent DNA ligase (Contains BRCT domain type II) n=1 Tax=Isoalcanivorax pacificus W11-5 TaxID=391936 RepID=A0A0B4XIP3_9GAMM|nr:BRCT domain-containing protein [Isoalcanivorax pacificus]AJD46565.1 NAD-dependent DNA ligase (contains BRCT domain type II) [Isoalcanivorax pacificus W11-5]